MSRHHDRLGARRWGRARRQALDAAGWRCESCGRAGRLEVDHVTPLAAGGGLWAPDNHQALCRPCHFAKTAAERSRPEPPEVAAWRALVDELAESAGSA